MMHFFVYVFLINCSLLRTDIQIRVLSFTPFEEKKGHSLEDCAAIFNVSLIKRHKDLRLFGQRSNSVH